MEDVLIKMHDLRTEKWIESKSDNHLTAMFGGNVMNTLSEKWATNISSNNTENVSY
jgi:acyl-CoA hydrolase